MSQIVDLVFILFVVIVAVRQFPAIAATVSRALRRRSTAEEAADESRMPRGTVMKVCERCQTASPLHAHFCSQCGKNLLPYVN